MYLHYFIIAASKNRAQLFEVTGDIIKPHPIEGMPGSMADSWVGMERQEGSTQMHSTGSGVGMFHGQGGASEVREQEEDKYMHDLAHSLQSFIHNQPDALVFAGVEEEYGMFKKFDQSGRLLTEYVKGSPDRMPMEELKEKADPIAKKHVLEQGAQSIEQYGNLLGTGRTSNDLSVILAAAEQGKVELLLISEGTETADTVVQDAMTHTLAHRGHIAYIAAGSLPEEAVIGAILRL